MKNKLAVSLLCLKNLNKLDIFLKKIKDKKINYIELPIPKVSPHYKYDVQKFKKIRDKLDNYNVKISQCRRYSLTRII